MNYTTALSEWTNFPSRSAQNPCISILVCIPEELKELLVPLRPKDGGEDQYVFHTADGRPLSQATFKRKWCELMLASGCADWRDIPEGTNRPNDILKQVKPRLTPHFFRHNYVTMLYESGVDPLIAMKIVGHRDYQTTANVYTHVRDEMLKKSTVDLDGVFKKRGSERGKTAPHIVIQRQFGVYCVMGSFFFVLG